MSHFRATLLSMFLLSLGAVQAQTYWESRVVLPGAGEFLRYDDGKRWYLDLLRVKRSLNEGNSPSILLPRPNGDLLTFNLEEEVVLAAELARRYPHLKAYRGQSREIPGLSVLLEVNSRHLFAALKWGDISWFIEPDPALPGAYFVYDSQQMAMSPQAALANCATVPPANEELPRLSLGAQPFGPTLRNSTQTLRKYRLALSCTAEYARAKGGTYESVMTSFLTAVNRVNQVLRRDAAVQLELVARNDSLIFFDPDKDPFPEPSNLIQLLNQNGAVINNIIGPDAYDLGHIFTSGCSGGVAGIAALGNVCSSGKARGVTCHYTSNVLQIAINVFAHEVGHQFSCAHSFNSCEGNQDNVVPSEGFEPGGGSTIMSYASACGSDNFQFSADDYFHAGSLDDFLPFTRTGAGSGCGTQVPTSNRPPNLQLTYRNGFTIPRSTPFRLEAEGSDADGDRLTYTWEQLDAGPTAPLGEPRSNSPLFRSFPPREESFRIFPSLPNLVAGTPSRVEILPAYARNLQFRCTVRDNHPQGGGVVWRDVSFRVTDLAGPFTVEMPTQRAVAGASLTVTWKVSGTDRAPINCSFVNLKLSTDKGLTFPIELARNTPNDGSARVTLPDIVTENARILVEAADNIFFQITEKDFPIEKAGAPFLSWKVEPAGIPLHCLPGSASFKITTMGVAGFDSTLTLGVKSGLPPDASFRFSKNPIRPGDTITLVLDFRSSRRDTLNLALTARTPGGIVYEQEAYIQTLSTDFSQLRTSRPSDGQQGIILSTAFEWAPSPAAEWYDVQLASSPRFGSADIISSVQNSKGTSFTPTQFLADNRLYFWRVRAGNACRTGEWTPVATFHTAVTRCEAFRNASLLNIPGVGTPTVESNIVVNQDGTIKDLNIPLLRANFEYVRNLRISLLSPKGTEVILFDQKCALTNKLVLGFDDESPRELACPPDAGIVFKPAQPLAAFQGEPLRGTWILRIRVMRRESITPGSLENWSIEFCSSSSPPALILSKSDTLLVRSGGRNPITPANLSLIHPSVADTGLRFILADLPRNGLLLRRTDTLALGQSFTQADIRAGAVTYVHTRTGTTADGLGYVSYDGEGGFLPLRFLAVRIDNSVPVRELEALEAQIFPNPAFQKVVIRWKAPPNTSSILEVRDLSGRLFHRQGMPPGQEEIFADATAWPRGTCHLTIRSGGKEASVLLILQ